MKNNLQPDTTVPKHADRFTVTRQVDLDIKDKVDRKAFEEAARLIDLPKVITDLDFVFITLICQATDKGKNEIWEHEGGAYVTLVLPYRFVVEHAKAEVTERFLDVYKRFVNQTTQVPNISIM